MSKCLSVQFLCGALLLCAALPVTAQDGVIYKCIDASKRVIFQNSPCPPGHETKSTRGYTDPGFNPYLAEKVERDRKAVEDRRARSRRSDGDYSFGWPSGSRSSGTQSACEVARQQRDAFRKTAGLETTYDQRRYYDERVYEACKGSGGVR